MIDHLTDAQAEGMDRAADPLGWDWWDRTPALSAAERNTWYAARLAAIRRAWAARPEECRAQDEADVAVARDFGPDEEERLQDVALARGRALLALEADHG